MRFRIRDTGPSSLMEAVGRFFFSALFGAALCLVLAAIVSEFVHLGWWYPRALHLFWIVPLVWGLLGIFWFDKMLRVAGELIERLFGHH